MAPQLEAAPHGPPEYPSSAIMAFGAAWLDAVEESARAWMSACAGMAKACATASQAQADMAGQMMTLWTEGFPALPGLTNPRELLRDELLLAEGQAERLADAARQTLSDLEGVGRANVVPLPE